MRNHFVPCLCYSSFRSVKGVLNRRALKDIGLHKTKDIRNHGN